MYMYPENLAVHTMLFVRPHAIYLTIWGGGQSANAKKQYVEHTVSLNICSIG